MFDFKKWQSLTQRILLLKRPSLIHFGYPLEVSKLETNVSIWFGYRIQIGNKYFYTDTDTDTDIFHLDSIYKSEERKKNAELARTKKQNIYRPSNPIRT